MLQKTISQKKVALIDYLLEVAADKKEYWKDKIERIFIPYVAVEIECLDGTESEKLIFLKQLLNNEKNEDNLGKVLACPQLLLGYQPHEPIIIHQDNVTPIFANLLKISLLDYILKNISCGSNNDFLWLDKQIKAIPLPPSPTLWQRFWRFHLNTPIFTRFGIGRIINCDQPHQVLEPFPGREGIFFSRLFFRLIFWLHIPIVLSLLKDFYWQSTQDLLNEFFQYIMGKRSYSDIFKISTYFTFLTFKILFAPIILCLPIMLGLTSLPATLLRHVILSVPHQSLFKDCLLGICDYFDNTKDAILGLFALFNWGIFLGNVLLVSNLFSPIANLATEILTWILLSFLLHPQSSMINELYPRYYYAINQPFFRLFSVTTTVVSSLTLILMISGRVTMNLVKNVLKLRTQPTIPPSLASEEIPEHDLILEEEQRTLLFSNRQENNPTEDTLTLALENDHGREDNYSRGNYSTRNN